MAAFNEDIAILQKFAEAVKKKYISALEEVSTTGKSIKSIESEVTSTSVTLTAGYWFRHIEYGRGSRKSSTETDFHEALKDWIVHKDSYVLTTKKDLDQATRSLRYLINMRGTSGYGKARGILSNIDISKEERELVLGLGNSWKAAIMNSIVAKSNFQFVRVTLSK